MAFIISHSKPKFGYKRAVNTNCESGIGRNGPFKCTGVETRFTQSWLTNAPIVQITALGANGGPINCYLQLDKKAAKELAEILLEWAGKGAENEPI